MPTLSETHKEVRCRSALNSQLLALWRRLGSTIKTSRCIRNELGYRAPIDTIVGRGLTAYDPNPEVYLLATGGPETSESSLG